MELFCLNGYNGEKIQLELVEVLGFPDETSYEGGYDVKCELRIDVGSYQVRYEGLFSATGALYRFSDELKNCYERLEGSAEYKLLLEDDLHFTVKMLHGGRAVVTGSFRECMDRINELTFEMETDQSCFPEVFHNIDSLKITYGGNTGVKK